MKLTKLHLYFEFSLQTFEHNQNPLEEPVSGQPECWLLICHFNFTDKYHYAVWPDIPTFSLSGCPLWIVLAYKSRTYKHQETWFLPRFWNPCSPNSLVIAKILSRLTTFNVRWYSLVILTFPWLAMADILNVLAAPKMVSMLFRWSMGIKYLPSKSWPP